MTDRSRCSSCGSLLPLGAPEGLCPKCLLRLGLEGTEESEKPTLAAPPGGIAREELGSIGPYALLQRLGEGGMGAVFLAEQTAPIRRRVAVKVIKRGMDTKEVIARFESERQALALMSHPNIATVLDAGTTADGLPYFVMEHVAGLPITEYCDRNRLDSRARLDLFHQVCLAIQHAHQKGIIHRDVKPSNVLVSEDDGEPRPRVIDFGIARAIDQRLTEKTLFTQRGVVVGTPGYMSPEQADPSVLDIDIRTDIYSLGVLLYELVAGVLPFDPKRLRSAGWGEMQRIIREEEPPKPSTRVSKLGAAATSVAERRRTNPGTLVKELSGDIDWIALKALEKDRARRYQSATELAADVARYLAHEPVEASPPSATYRLRKLVRRHRVAFASAAAVAAALVVGLVATAVQYRRAEAARRENRVQLVRMNAADGLRLAQEGDPFGALPWLTRALKLEERPDAVSHHRLRIGTLLDQTPRLVRLWTDGGSSGAFFSGDGRLVAAGGQKGIVSVWSVETGQPVAPPLESGQPVHWIAFDPDGRRLAIGGSAGARLWNLEKPDEGRALGSEGAVDMVAFSPDGLRVVTASADRAARVWDVVRGEPICSVPHEAPVRTAVFSPDGGSILSAGADGGVILADSRTCRPRVAPLVHSLAFFAFFSPGGERIVTGGGDFTARVWDAEGRALTPPLRHGNPVMWAAFSRDGLTLATAAEDNTARLWDAASGEARTSPLVHADSVTWVALSPDSRLLATVSESVRLWDTTTGKPVGARIWGGTRLLTAEFSGDGRYLLTAGDTVRVWDLAAAERPGPTLNHSQQVLGLEVLGQGRRVLTHVGVRRHPEGYARIWSIETGEPVTPPLRHRLALGGAAARRDESMITTVSRDGTARVWDPSTGEPRSAPIPIPSGDNPRVAFGPDGSTFAVRTTRTLSLFSADDARAVFPAVPLGPPVLCRGCISFDPAGGRLAVVAWNPPGKPEAAIVDFGSGTRRDPRLEFDKPLMTARFSPNGRSILATGDGFARLRDSYTGRDLVPPMLHSGRVEDGWFDSDGSRVSTITYDGEARVWDAATGEPYGPGLPHGGTLYRAEFSPDGRLVATCGLDGIARLWDPRSGLPVSVDLPHPDAVWDIRFVSAAKVVTACQDGRVRIWDLPVSAEPVADLEDLATVLSSQRVDSSGAIARVPASDVAAIFARLERERPELLRTSDLKAVAWHWRMGSELSAAGRFAESLSHFDTGMRLGPDRATLLAERANARAESGDFAGATSDFARAAALRPDDAELRQDLVLATLAARDFDAARKECLAMLERFGRTQNPDQARHTALACAAAGVPDPESAAKAVRLARVAIEIEPENPERLELLVQALRRSGDSRGAAEAARKASAIRSTGVWPIRKPDWRSRAVTFF